MTDSKELDAMVDEILRAESEWQRLRDEVNRLTKLRDEAISNYNKALSFKDKLVRPSSREVELAKGYASLVVKSVLSVPQNKVEYITLLDHNRVLSVSNIDIDYAWIKKLFGSDVHWFRECGDVMTICISGRAIFNVVDCPETLEGERPGVNVYKDSQLVLTCYTCADLEKVFEEIAKEVRRQ